ncbi:MAG: isochorismatase [Candidatus Eremiobacteraeota bacterium]|nr:isochorismatase [Candidatus Eremiobacteraeota bacterium]
MRKSVLPLPSHFDRNKVGEVWRVPYQQRFTEALEWARRHHVDPAAKDRFRICLMVIDAQNTFCIPGFELFVGGRSGSGAVDDNVRLCEFIYRNLPFITEIAPTLDTHTAMQIFHPFFLVNDEGKNPAPMTAISVEDIEKGLWKVNPAIAHSVAKGNYLALQRHLLHYARKLSEGGKYQLMIWPYHAMLGGIGHCLVASLEEALFFHAVARGSQTGFEIKGGNPLTENYSVLRPEVLDGADGSSVAQKNARFIKKLLEFDAVIIAGQAKSHCVAWTIDDLLGELVLQDEKLARKVYLLEDCTSPVVVPGIVDFSDEADAAFRRFRDAGMNIVRSTEDIAAWPGISLPAAA